MQPVQLVEEESRRLIKELESRTEEATRQMDKAVEAILANLHDIEETLGLHESDTNQDNFGAASMVRRAVAQQASSSQQLMEQVSRVAGELKSESRLTISKAEEVLQTTGAVFDVVELAKLLALNAAIKAAHLGSRASGIAIIAEEVSSLSNRVEAVNLEIRACSDELQTLLPSLEAEVQSVDDASKRFLQATSECLSRIGQGSEHLISQVQEAAQQWDQLGERVQRVLSSARGNLNFRQEVQDRLVSLKQKAQKIVSSS